MLSLLSTIAISDSDYRTADIVIRRLVEAGVQTFFGMPGGGSNLDLIEAAGRAGLPFVMSHTETAGAFMACIPMIVLFVVGQRYFVRGIVLSGLKG